MGWDRRLKKWFGERESLRTEEEEGEKEEGLEWGGRNGLV